MNNGGKSALSIFEYRDYRAYLKDWYGEAKRSRASFSFRSFAKKAGFHTSNFLMLVMKGKRNLTEESLKKFIVGLSLNKQEQEFFRNLVFFNQAGRHEDKNFYYQRLLQSKKFSQLKPIEKRQYEYYSAWYHPAVRELVVSREFDGTPEWIAGRLSPPITRAQAEKSIELLEGLGLIQKNGDGRFRQASSIVTTGPELTSVVVHNYHKILLDLSKEVMDRLSMGHRDASSMTLGVKRERLPQLRAKIREFRQEILKLVANDTEPEEVALLNIQLYPVTKAPDAQSKKGRDL
ncbi:MAG: TIGR02147 family protein [Deltaproteobacteria bacterium]|nr:TIGR02147 family protein [Deltaproteobacteria bacterium]